MTGRYDLSIELWALIEEIVSPPRGGDVHAGMIGKCSMASSGSCARAPPFFYWAGLWGFYLLSRLR